MNHYSMQIMLKLLFFIAYIISFYYILDFLCAFYTRGTGYVVVDKKRVVLYQSSMSSCCTKSRVQPVHNHTHTLVSSVRSSL
jgi:hypothetical protein